MWYLLTHTYNFTMVKLDELFSSAKLKSFERKNKQQVHVPHRSHEKTDEINKHI